MAVTVQASGSQLMTLNTDVAVGAAITTAGVYELVFNSTPLSGYDELLVAVVESKVLTGSTVAEEDRFVVARGTDAVKVKKLLPITSTWSVQFRLRQEGGVARTIDYEIRKLQ